MKSPIREEDKERRKLSPRGEEKVRSDRAKENLNNLFR
jgi:hypothetical protein